jgi:GSH-dependent disulfide-bond oxidoreductase
MFGQVGFFNKFAGKAYEDKRPRDRYATESARLLGVLDERLAGRDWVMGADYSIADISLLGWVRNLIGFYVFVAGVRIGRDKLSRPNSASGEPLGPSGS